MIEEYNLCYINASDFRYGTLAIVAKMNTGDFRFICLTYHSDGIDMLKFERHELIFIQEAD